MCLSVLVLFVVGMLLFDVARCWCCFALFCVSPFVCDRVLCLIVCVCRYVLVLFSLLLFVLLRVVLFVVVCLLFGVARVCSCVVFVCFV